MADLAVWTSMHVSEWVEMLASCNTTIGKISKFMDMEAVKMVISKPREVPPNVCSRELPSLLETNDSFGG